MPDCRVSCQRFFPVRMIAEVERPWETPTFGSEAVNSVIVGDSSIDKWRVMRVELLEAFGSSGVT